MLLARCAYCDGWLTDQNRTKEHLVPKSIGGHCVIYVCGDCNTRRADSLDDPQFLNFIRGDPVLFTHHVSHATLSDENKEKLLSLIGVDNSALTDLNCPPLSNTCEKSELDVVAVDDRRVKELVRQYMALEFSNMGHPLEGGRSAKALHKSTRKAERRRRRHTLRNEARHFQNAKEYVNIYY